jgi:hypothetical protein
MVARLPNAKSEKEVWPRRGASQRLDITQRSKYLAAAGQYQIRLDSSSIQAVLAYGSNAEPHYCRCATFLSTKSTVISNGRSPERSEWEEISKRMAMQNDEISRVA